MATANVTTKEKEKQVPFGEVDQNSDSSEKKGSTADVESPTEDVIVLDGAKLKSLIKDYARDCIKEEIANVLKMFLQ